MNFGLFLISYVITSYKVAMLLDECFMVINDFCHRV